MSIDFKVISKEYKDLTPIDNLNPIQWTSSKFITDVDIYGVHHKFIFKEFVYFNDPEVIEESGSYDYCITCIDVSKCNEPVFVFHVQTTIGDYNETKIRYFNKFGLTFEQLKECLPDFYYKNCIKYDNYEKLTFYDLRYHVEDLIETALEYPDEDPEFDQNNFFYVIGEISKNDFKPRKCIE